MKTARRGHLFLETDRPVAVPKREHCL